MMRKSLVKIVSLLGMLFLQSCANVAVTGAQAVYNHHSIQKTINDQYITMQAYQKFQRDDRLFKNTNIAIATFNSEVLLAGQADKWQRMRAEEIIKTIPNVERVYNLIEISSPSSTLVRMSDAWITAKVKSKLIASNDVDATQVKVVTENGTVYLMGILEPDAANVAIDIARNTDGVEQVVKMFSYIRITRA